MSLVTRCPACSTMFKVVPDQIRIAAGWVRCGHCNEVFDAAAHMLPYESISRSVASKPKQIQEKEPPKEEPRALAERPVTKQASAPAVKPEMPAADASTGDSVPDLMSEFIPYEDIDPLASRQRPHTSWLSPANAEGDTAPLRMDFKSLDSLFADEAWLLDSRLGTIDDMRMASDSRAQASRHGAAKRSSPSFVASARRRAFWSSRPIRVGLWLTSLLLLLGLVLQVALSLRDGLAAHAPWLEPTLQALCKPLDCRIQPYRHLGAIIVDSLDFYRVDANNFLLKLTLRNVSDVPVASPALELILTDARDRPLVRRVLTPAELGAAPTLAARGEFNSVSTLSVSNAANPSAIADYRGGAFYP